MWIKIYSFIFILFFSILYPLFSAPDVRAAGEFTTVLESTYIVSSSGSMHVVQNFTLTNKLSTIYATQYALEVGSTKIKNVIIKEKNIVLPSKVTPYSNKTGISFSFGEKIVGKDQARKFSVEYDSDDLATKTGTVLEVSIPKLANPTTFDQYSVTIDVDGSYEAPSLATPKIFTTSTQNDRSLITFTDPSAKDGVSLLFGTQQIAKLGITYHLENPQDTRGIIQIALPSDGTYQRLYYEYISPLPLAITQDADGNWLAIFSLESKEKLTVKTALYAVITLKPQENAPLLEERPGSEYMAKQPFWETNDTQIQKLARQLKTPKAIYSYVVKTLSYDYKRLEGEGKRLGAKDALNSPTSSVCTEFTDLFVTLARSAGIPARAVQGYAYTQNDRLRPLSLVRDVLHAWAQYWDEETSHWVSVDPTWENTTGGVDYFNRLDFNHIAFAIQGISSEKPYPAGMYKFENSDSKDISIEFLEKFPTPENTFETQVQLSPRSLFHLQPTYSLTITNTSLHALYAEPFTIKTNTNNSPPSTHTGTITLTPLGKTVIPVQLPTHDLFSTHPGKIVVQIGDQIFEHEVNIQSLIQTNSPFVIFAGVVVSCLALIAFICWRLLVPRHKRKRHLRREGKESKK